MAVILETNSPRAIAMHQAYERRQAILRRREAGETLVSIAASEGVTVGRIWSIVRHAKADRDAALERERTPT